MKNTDSNRQSRTLLLAFSIAAIIAATIFSVTSYYSHSSNASAATRAPIAKSVAQTTTTATPARFDSATDSTTQADKPKPEPKPLNPKPAWKCKNQLAKTLYAAGFTGYSHQMAWAITMRESKGQNLDESSPWYSGALGIWQIQTSAHSGKHWWSRGAMLDPYTQSRIVYKHMTNKGKYWVPWGLNPDGSLNASHYGGWSSWHHENWIMAPFRQFMGQYPCKDTPPKKS
jgi:hypothetical protein